LKVTHRARRGRERAFSSIQLSTRRAFNVAVLKWRTPLNMARKRGQDGQPLEVRIAYYDYRFTTRAERARSGAWWIRTLKGYLN
jgi:hypothetical protein